MGARGRRDLWGFLAVALGITLLLVGAAVFGHYEGRRRAWEGLREEIREQVIPGPAEAWVWGDEEAALEEKTRRRLERFREEAEELVLQELANGKHHYAYLAAHFKMKKALPLLRKNLLEDRYFYGWEGPDYSKGESYLEDQQYPHHLAYIKAIEEFTGRPLAKAVALTPAERAALEAEAAGARPGTPEAYGKFCARWLLMKLAPQEKSPPAPR